MSPDALAAVRRLRILPLIVIDDPARAGQLGRALLDGGLPVAEVAFRTPAALAALKAMVSEHPELLVGAGTVINQKQAREAHQAGAKFIVSPGFHVPVVDYCLANNIPLFPGTATPSEIGAALERGISVVKFFPAEPLGGIEYLKAIAAPFTGAQFIPTGGITAANLGSYLALKQVVACGGSWMAPQAMIAAGEFDKIKAEVAKAVALASGAGKAA